MSSNNMQEPSSTQVSKTVEELSLTDLGSSDLEKYQSLRCDELNLYRIVQKLSSTHKIDVHVRETRAIRTTITNADGSTIQTVAILSPHITIIPEKSNEGKESRLAINIASVPNGNHWKVQVIERPSYDSDDGDTYATLVWGDYSALYNSNGECDKMCRGVVPVTDYATAEILECDGARPLLIADREELLSTVWKMLLISSTSGNSITAWEMNAAYRVLGATANDSNSSSSKTGGDELWIYKNKEGDEEKPSVPYWIGFWRMVKTISQNISGASSSGDLGVVTRNYHIQRVLVFTAKRIGTSEALQLLNKHSYDNYIEADAKNSKE